MSRPVQLLVMSRPVQLLVWSRPVYLLVWLESPSVFACLESSSVFACLESFSAIACLESSSAVACLESSGVACLESPSVSNTQSRATLSPCILTKKVVSVRNELEDLLEIFTGYSIGALFEMLKYVTQITLEWRIHSSFHGRQPRFH